jgi:hypothetical protein
MGFMHLYSEFGTWYKVTSTGGEGTLVPADLVGPEPEVVSFADYIEGEPAEFERKEGWAARYSANGYLDCTEWCGVYETKQEALDACRELYGDDEEEETDE